MSSSLKRFFLILLLIVFCLYVTLPDQLNIAIPKLPTVNLNLKRPDINLHLGSFSFVRPLKYHLGLDLAGGSQITLLTDMKDITSADRETAMSSVREVVSRRVDLYGVSEPTIRTLKSGDNYQIVVELPGLENPDAALKLIGQTARLSFLRPGPQSTPSAAIATQSGLLTMPTFLPTDLTGADLKKSAVTFDQKTAQPVVSIEFTPQGGDKFAKLTQELIGQQLGIALDNQIITAPVVNTVIEGGSAIITGNFTVDTAKALSIQLNAGALPVPISIVQQKTTAPTLGQDSINQSVRAGLVGLLAVVVFLTLLYGWMGVIASAGLAIYALITLALYRLGPITLSLPGITGFLLSVGMAVDSNILIFERYREEIRTKPHAVALELAFGRAWDSIKDANVTTLITAFILFNPLNWNFLPTSGPVRGFALTLAVGIATSLFTGIYVTRTLLRLLYRGAKVSFKK